LSIVEDKSQENGKRGTLSLGIRTRGPMSIKADLELEGRERDAKSMFLCRRQGEEGWG